MKHETDTDSHVRRGLPVSVLGFILAETLVQQQHERASYGQIDATLTQPVLGLMASVAGDVPTPLFHMGTGTLLDLREMITCIIV